MQYRNSVLSLHAKRATTLILFAATLLSFSILGACAKLKSASAEEVLVHQSNANPELVAWHTKGDIRSNASIAIGFVQECVSSDMVGKNVPDDAIRISPQIKGSWVWTNQRSVTFQPTGTLEREKAYLIKVLPEKLNLTLKESYAPFEFSFSILPTSFSVKTWGFSNPDADDFEKVQFRGQINANEAVAKEVFEGLLQAQLDNKTVALTWIIESDTRADFFLENIEKTNRDQILRLKGKTKALEKYDQQFTLSRIEDFKLDRIRLNESGERYIEATFTHPLDSKQDLRGLISSKPKLNLRTTISGNTVRIYFPENNTGTIELSFDTAIKNTKNQSLSERSVHEVELLAIVPEIRFLNKGVIVPRLDSVNIPIETVNLNAVIVTIEKIFGDRIGQFLQINELDGKQDMYRVGRRVWQKIVPLAYTPELQNSWLRTALDLSPLLDDQDHSMYRISISFDIRCVEYPGDKPDATKLMDFYMEDIPLAEHPGNFRILDEKFWEDYRIHQRPYLDWSTFQRNQKNPYHPAFYRSNYYSSESSYTYGKHVISRNVLVSNIGLTAQKDDYNSYLVAASDLLTTQALKDADVRFYDYQLQEISYQKTDANGMARIQHDAQDVFLVVVEYQNQRAYLRLSGASTLPVSNFDVSGQSSQQGIKGYIYGERGVWRPGDDIYLTFVLWDSEKTLPANHPVILRFYDPRGKLVEKISDVRPVGNFYSYKLKTQQDSITGTYRVDIQVGGLSFSHNVPVETIKPNRLKIELGFGKDIEQLTTEKRDMEVQVNWLHGAPAQNMKVDIQAAFSTVQTSFPGFLEYQFNDEAKQFESSSKEIYEGQLDEKGFLSFPLGLQPGSSAPGKLSVRFKTRAYEPGGDFSTDVFSMPYSPYKNYAGLLFKNKDRYSTSFNVDKPHPVKLALVDENGEPLDGDLKIEVYKVDWRWWWDNSSGDVARYLGRPGYERIISDTVSAKKGNADWELRFPERMWGRFYIRISSPSGHSTGKFFYAWWSDWYYPSSSSASAVDMLVINTDKNIYQVGETAKISFKSSGGGNALLSVENGGGIISSQWIRTTDNQTTFELPITKDMTPNIYLHMSMIQAHSQTSNDRPIRMFGIQSLMVENQKTKLEPLIRTTDNFEPEEEATIVVSESNGQTMTYTLAIVDEGLLSLTRFATPNLWKHFFQREASKLRTYDIYNMVSGAYTGILDRLLAIGGSDDTAGDEGQKANRFPPMVRVIGPFNLKAGEKASHTIKMPQYLGAVRVMLVAGNDTAFGSAEKTVTVKKPLMAYSSLPRTCSITEKFSMPVTIFALENSIKDVNITVKTNDRIKIIGAETQKIRFNAIGDQLVNFELEALDQQGIARIEVIARSGNMESRQMVEMDVRVPTAMQSTVQTLTLAPGKAWEETQKLFGIAGTNSVMLELSRFKPINLGNRLAYLIRYPYGCIEQTTSAVFPQLYLEKVQKLTPEQINQIRTNIQDAIQRLTQFQVSGGGLAYWPGGSSASSYGSVYAAHFLFTAEKLGYHVPSSLKDNLVRYLKDFVNSSYPSRDYYELTYAYALFDLALAGQPDLGAMNRMRESRDLTHTARYKLASTYALSGRRDEAMKLVGGPLPVIEDYYDHYDTYGSSLRDYAILSEGLILGGDTDRALPLLLEIADHLSSDTWYSTQTLSYSLLAIGSYLASEPQSETISLEYSWDGTKSSIESSHPIHQEVLNISGGSVSKPLQLQNKGTSNLYVQIITSGQPTLGEEQPSKEGLDLSVSYYDSDGDPIADISSVHQGQDIRVEITVRNLLNYRIKDLALDYIVPSGCEITNIRFEGGELEQDYFDFQDIRDDRIYTFFSLNRNSKKTFSFLLSPSFIGKYYRPSPRVHAMYDAKVQASLSSGWMSINAAPLEP